MLQMADTERKIKWILASSTSSWSILQVGLHDNDKQCFNWAYQIDEAIQFFQYLPVFIYVHVTLDIK